MFSQITLKVFGILDSSICELPNGPQAPINNRNSMDVSVLWHLWLSWLGDTNTGFKKSRHHACFLLLHRSSGYWSFQMALSCIPELLRSCKFSQGEVPFTSQPSQQIRWCPWGFRVFLSSGGKARFHLIFENRNKRYSQEHKWKVGGLCLAFLVSPAGLVPSCYSFPFL